MAGKELSEMERLVAVLKAKGWVEQKGGSVYINGTLGTSLLKDGEMISIQQDSCPDEEIVDQLWPDE